MVLQMLAMGIKDVINFDFMDKPSPQVRLFKIFKISDIEILARYIYENWVILYLS